MSITFHPTLSPSITDRRSAGPYVLEKLSALLGISNNELLGALGSANRLPDLLTDAPALPLAVADSMLQSRKAVTTV